MPGIAASRQCLDLFPEAILLAGTNGQILFVNRSAQRLLGSTRVETSSLFELFTEPEEAVRDYLRLCSRSGGLTPGRLSVGDNAFRCEGALYQSRTQDAPAKVLLRLTPSGDAVRGFVALNEQIEQLSREVQRRRRAEAELIEQRERLHVTLSGIGDAVIATDVEARITFMNPVAELQTGWTSAEALGRPLADVFHIVTEESRAVVENPVRRALSEGRIIGLANHTVLLRRDGSEIHIDDSGAPIRDAAGCVIGAVLVFHDISERRQLEQQVEARTRELEGEHRRKDEFLAMLGHELRNPLAPIKTAVTLLELSQGDRATGARAREVLQRQVSHLTRLVDELLDVARITTGRMLLRTEPVDPVVFVRLALEQCEPLIRDKEQRLVFHGASEPLSVNADVQRMTQAVGNLLNNASRYTPPGGEIHLTLQRAGGSDGDGYGGYVEIAVEDNGNGIDAEALPHVFSLFRQAGRTLARSEGGLGIGLTLVKRLAESHGGSVSAASEGPGRGSRFTIRLPLAPTVAAAPRASSRTTDVARAHKVLVVDDNLDAAATLAEVLGLLGHAVRVAHDGPGALQLAREMRPDAVFLDIGLPGMDGYQVARTLRAELAAASCGAPVLLVALTGYGQPEDRIKAREAGFDHHMIKPTPIEEVVRLLAALSG
jgi:PAS domain S-box-containing protein